MKLSQSARITPLPASSGAHQPRSARPCRRAVAGAWLVLGLAMPLVSFAQGAAPAAPTPPGAAPANKQDFSEAERLLFMGRQLTALKPPTTLRYTFRKSGSLEEAFEDTVTLSFKRAADGSCCAVSGDFLTGARRLQLPAIENAEANPVLLYFLEHDVRDMQRLTKGNHAYYRKRLRMAAYEGATVTPVSVVYRGKTVPARQVDLAPYRDDPARSRFEKFSRKTYRFLLSDAVPGGVFGMRTVMQGDSADAPPMIVEELFLDGAVAPQASPTT
jgi:hypothetical protein